MSRDRDNQEEMYSVVRRYEIEREVTTLGGVDEI